MRTTVIIQNLKCNDCKNRVAEVFSDFNGISNLVIDISSGILSFDYKTHNALEGLRIKLAEIGLPITYDPNVIKKPPRRLVS